MAIYNWLWIDVDTPGAPNLVSASVNDTVTFSASDFTTAQAFDNGAPRTLNLPQNSSRRRLKLTSAPQSYSTRNALEGIA